MPPIAAPAEPTPLTDALRDALRDTPTLADPLSGEEPAALRALTAWLPASLQGASQGASQAVEPRVGRRDRVLALLELHDLVGGPLHPLARWGCTPTLAALRTSLETAWLRELAADAAGPSAAAEATSHGGPEDLVGALRALAARDRLPEAYRWLARGASWEELVAFLALEGGPDAGFDDLVAVCQTGLGGRPKMELAINYWDEMGEGDPDAVHTVLHERLVQAIAMPLLEREAQPVEGLERAALGGVLAANHWLQPEMLGALGLTELQAGPRCRLVLQAFDRLGAPEAAYPFYRVHAEVDPRHGKDWVEGALVPLVEEHPEWGERIVRGARWRSATNRRFFAISQLAAQLAVRDRPSSAERQAGALAA